MYTDIVLRHIILIDELFIQYNVLAKVHHHKWGYKDKIQQLTTSPSRANTCTRVYFFTCTLTVKDEPQCR